VKKGNRLEAVRHAKKFLATDENQQLGQCCSAYSAAVSFLSFHFPFFPYESKAYINSQTNPYSYFFLPFGSVFFASSFLFLLVPIFPICRPPSSGGDLFSGYRSPQIPPPRIRDQNWSWLTDIGLLYLHLVTIPYFTVLIKEAVP
jgi:hypothetical protein